MVDSQYLCLVARGGDPERARLTIPGGVPVGDRAELEAVLGRMLEANRREAAGGVSGGSRTLDLVGYATADKLLAIGDLVIDADDRSVLAFFRELAEHDVLARLGVRALRLIASSTGATPRGMDAMRAVAEVLDIPVYGTTEPIYARHFDAMGFCATGSLVSSDNDPSSMAPPPPSPMPQRELSIDRLAARPLSPGERVAVASRDHARALLELVARTAGVAMPGLLAQPYCELALPTADASSFHRVELILSGDFLRAYLDGPDAPGVVFPVRDRHAAQHIVAAIRP